MEQELDTIHCRVAAILKAKPETRNSDKLLLKQYYKIVEGVETNLDLVNVSPESITRSRRKLQKEHPELEAKECFKQARSEKADRYKKYYRG